MKKNFIILFVLLGVFNLKAQQTLTMNQPNDFSYCMSLSGVSTTPIVFSSPSGLSGITYSWTRTTASSSNFQIVNSDNNVSSIPSFQIDNASGVRSSVFTITPVLEGYVGIPVTFTIYAIPISTLYPHNVPRHGSLEFCPGNSTVNFSSPNATGYTWTNSNTAIGLGASSGSTPIPFEFDDNGDGIAAINFIATNNTSQPITSTIRITPFINNCAGTPSFYVVTVKPTPVISVNNVEVCSGRTVSRINFSILDYPGEGTFQWEVIGANNINMPITSGTTSYINSFTAGNNLGTIDLVNTIRVTASHNGCLSEPFLFTITVRPRVQPVFNNICNMPLSVLPTVSDNGIQGTWSPYRIHASQTRTYTFTPINANTVPTCYSNFQITITPQPTPPVIVASPDSANIQIPSTSSVNAVNVLTNDLFNGIPALLSNVHLTQLSTSNPGIHLDLNTGNVIVDTGVTFGTYNLQYQICNNCGTVCSSSSVTIEIPYIYINSSPKLSLTFCESPFAQISTYSVFQGFEDNQQGNGTGFFVTVGGVPASSSNVIITSTDILNFLSFNTDGTINVVAGALPTEFIDPTFHFTLCPTISPTSMCTSPITLTVSILDLAHCVNKTSNSQVKEISGIKGLIIEPNPSKSIFNINFGNQLKQETAIDVYNVLGQKVYETKVNGVVESQIDLSNYPSGNYLIKISNSEQTISKTLIKE